MDFLLPYTNLMWRGYKELWHKAGGGSVPSCWPKIARYQTETLLIQACTLTVDISESCMGIQLKESM